MIFIISKIIRLEGYQICSVDGKVTLALMDVVDRRKIITMIRRTLNLVDDRLVDHGVKTAFVLRNMMQAEGKLDDKEQQRLRMLAVFHDIGAYRSEEINKIVKFETEDVWAHAVNSYLFIRDFFPDELSKIVLYHHADYNVNWHESDYVMHYSQMLHIADRVCIWHDNIKGSKQALLDYLEKSEGYAFSPYVTELFKKADRLYGIWDKLSEKDILNSFPQNEFLERREAEDYLYILVNSIDFRSRSTVIHTRSVMEMALEIANIMNLSDSEKKKVYFGALLHDLGKIGTPLSILEKPGKLESREMEIMRQHVVLSKMIMDGCVDDEVVRIATRHHEKPNGNGYPLGLTEKDLTVLERLLAVADVMSALCMARSYKDAFSKEKTVGILKSMADSNDLDKDIVKIATDNFDRIIEKTRMKVIPVQQEYESMPERFKKVMDECISKAGNKVYI